MSPAALDLPALGPAALGISAPDVRSIGSKPALTAVQNKTMTPEQKRLMGAAQDFEGILITQMLTAMRHAHLAKDPLDSGNASDIMHSMLDAQLGKQIAHSQSFGLADAIYREFAGMVGPAGQQASPAAARPASDTAKPGRSSASR